MSRNGFRYTYLSLTALAWTIFLVIMYGSARNRGMSSLIDGKDPKKRENVDQNNSMEKDKDFGEQRRKDKLANQLLQEDIQKENEEIIKSNKINEREIKGENNPDVPLDEIMNEPKVGLREDVRNNRIETIVGKIGNVVDNEKDKGRKILNENEKERKNKMGKRLKDQLKDHKNKAIDQIISDIE